LQRAESRGEARPAEHRKIDDYLLRRIQLGSGTKLIVPAPCSAPLKEVWRDSRHIGMFSACRAPAEHAPGVGLPIGSRPPWVGENKPCRRGYLGVRALFSFSYFFWGFGFPLSFLFEWSTHSNVQAYLTLPTKNFMSLRASYAHKERHLFALGLLTAGIPWSPQEGSHFFS